MKLIRGWEEQYLPQNTGNIRLSKGMLFRALGEEDGIGDSGEGEVRLQFQGNMTQSWNEPVPHMAQEALRESNEAVAEQYRQHIAELFNDPNASVEPQDNLASKHIISHSIRIDDTDLDSPVIFCLSEEPTTLGEWVMLRKSLPKRHNAWTVTENIHALQFEVEWGIKRWLALQEITNHRIIRQRGRVTYSDNPINIGQFDSENINLKEMISMHRWFQKRYKYSHQREYRLAWMIDSLQINSLPDTIEIELTKTGLSMFKPWTPPR